jgi:pimeloyl-ACP methyl ester carboxylesterase/DNA-binding CsgD family transcriptional regulator
MVALANVRDADRPRPATRYAVSGGVHVAWQASGSGERDVLFIPGWVSNVEANWAFPEIAHFLDRLAALGRLLVFDKRGTGLSDRTARMPTMHERMQDIRAVLEAAEARPAIVVGSSEGCALAIEFAATHPDRCAALVLYGGYARRTPTADYPWAPSREARRAFLDEVLANWGGPMDLSTLAPSRADDVEFVERFARYLRASASPGAAHALARMNTFVDVTDELAKIRLPTLVLHRRGDRDMNIEEARFLVRRLLQATLVEFDGDDHWPFVGDSDALLDAIAQFVSTLVLPVAAGQASPAQRRQSRPDRLTTLTPRQREVLELVAQGLSNRQIASLAGVSEHTIHRHVADIRERLEVPTRAAAAALFSAGSTHVE